MNSNKRKFENEMSNDDILTFLNEDQYLYKTIQLCSYLKTVPSIDYIEANNQEELSIAILDHIKNIIGKFFEDVIFTTNNNSYELEYKITNNLARTNDIETSMRMINNGERNINFDNYDAIHNILERYFTEYFIIIEDIISKRFNVDLGILYFAKTKTFQIELSSN